MEPTTITIRQLRERNEDVGVCFGNSLIATNRIGDIERFHSPCRIDAVTVLVCTGGSADCCINLKDYHLGADMILVNLPEDIIRISHAEGLEAYAVLISTDLLNRLNIDFSQRSDFYMGLRQNAVCRLPHQEVTNLKPYYSLLISNIARPKPETAEVIRGLALAFCNTIISLTRQFCQHDDGSDARRVTRNQQLFRKFMSLVKEHHATARGVRFYADKLCLTPNYLSGAIKEYSGRTATEWVNQYVILEAKVMLEDTTRSIQEIAYKLNFTSQSAFGKYFKQQTGLSPKQYRSRDKELP